MIEKRPKFEKITSFDEFNKYYWYREEISQICKSLGLEYRGTKQELNHIIEQYFKGNLIKKSSIKNTKKQVENITLDTPLLECGFSFNAKFREYFSTLTGISPFKFTADMATAWRKVKSEKNIKFTIEDLLKVYYGKSDYAKYDNSVCQWNQFLKDFCADENSRNYSNKLKVASILWKEVRNSEKEKIYSKNLLTEYAYKLEEYRK
ncbi:SAP domain-containing protein [Gemella sp. 27098_8_92]|uniref:SAP domain-containing protein n=1 Tax=Gemella sp. 27098_8_92 TaxID=3003687 RepID=UPI00352EEEB0